MKYDEFRAAWDHALQASGLPAFGSAEERLDLRSMERSYKVGVEPVGRQLADPFRVTATLSWRWDALKTARTRSTEEDLLTELHGRRGEKMVETEQPRLRVDVVLRASLPWGKGIALPAPTVWTNWAQEATERMHRIEPLVTEDAVEETDGGDLAILAWPGEPSLQVSCSEAGELKLEGVEFAAWQAVKLPRVWDAPEREPDEDPDQQLDAMFAWMEVMDHLA